MKTLLLILTLPAAAQILDVSTGTRCTATFVPATAATDIQLDCFYRSKPVMTGAKVNLAAITGNTSGFVVGFATGTDSVAILLKRTAADSSLYVEASVNGTMVATKTIPVP
jgi:hypothetical protein